MVAYLEKSDGNIEFHLIVDFLSTCSINYALTISPTMYASYIEQFWNTATSKTVNSLKQIHAIVDGKAVVILESSVRNDLLFDDEDGITYLPNDEIFENLALMGYEQLSTKLTFQKEGHTSRSGEGSMEHTFELTDNVPPTPYDSPLTGGYTPGSDEGRLKLKELMAIVQIVKTGQISSLLRWISDEEMHPNMEEQGNKDKPMDMENVDGETINTATPRVSVVSAPVTTAGVAISTVEPRTPPTTAATAFIDEDLTIAQTLVKMRSEKGKEKGVAFRDVEETHILTRSTITLQPLPTFDPKDKGKGVLVEEEPEKPEKLAELDKAQKEKQKQEKATNAALAEEFDEIQAMIDANYELVTRMTQEEQEKYTIEERASQLKGKSYEEIQGLYERQQKRIQDFKPIHSEKEAQKPAKRLKRVAGSYATQKSPKKPKVMKSAKDVIEEEAAEYDKEKEELRLSLKIISNDDSEVNYEPLSRQFPIVNWEYQLLGKMDEKDMYVYKLTRADGSSSYHGDTHAFLRKLDRQDLNDLYKVIFDLDEKDELWMNQLDWKMLRWKLYESCGVHTLFMDGKPMEINMLVEKKYPLIKKLLEKMLNLQLEAEEESTMAFELIKFIKSLLEE
ncbi:hypothetical protein Tco_1555141 [Tanacetum coccineum]